MEFSSALLGVFTKKELAGLVETLLNYAIYEDDERGESTGILRGFLSKTQELKNKKREVEIFLKIEYRDRWNFIPSMPVRFFTSMEGGKLAQKLLGFAAFREDENDEPSSNLRMNVISRNDRGGMQKINIVVVVKEK
jgi:hypothetical protein